jgi:hypothetical protein
MMKNDLRLRHFMTWLWLAAVAALVSACGGGGVSSTTPAPAPTPPALSVLPSTTVVMFSNQPTTFTINGGTSPYQVFSSNANLVTVPASVALAAGATSASFVAVARTTTVAGGEPVTITVRDSAGQTIDVVPTVRPTLVSSAVNITPNAASVCGSGTCSGGDGLVRVTLALAGQGLAARSVRFDVLSGAMGFVNDTTQVLGATASTTTDGNGVATIRYRTTQSAPTQIAVFRVSDVTGGSFFDFTLNIVATPTESAELAVIPNDFRITSGFTDRCTSGARVDFVVFGGTAPYRLTTTIPDSVRVTPAQVTQAGAAFTVETAGLCFDPQTLVITDSASRRQTVTLRNIVGTNAPPPFPMGIIPPVLTRLECGQSTTAIITNGSGTFFASSSVPSAVTALVTGRVVTVQRLSGAPGVPNISPERAVITVGDGITTQAFSVDVPIQCNVSSVPLQSDATTGITLACSASQTVTITGGTGVYQVNPGSVFLNVSPVTGSTSQFVFRRLPGGPVGGTGATTVVNAVISDSLRSINIPITTPNNCL